MPLPSKPLPPLKVAREYFTYDSKTGSIFNRTSKTNRRSGERAESQEAGGYLVVSIRGALFKAHRMAWLLHYGSEPTGVIDHIDGNRKNNAIENLRDAKHHMNMCNRPAPPHNTSGIKGVSRHGRKWRASVTVDRKRHNLGTFERKEDAAAVVRDARIRLHGEYARN